MAAEKQENTEATEAAANEAEVKTVGKSGMLKYIIIGGGAFVVVILIVLAAILFLGGDSREPAESDAQPVEIKKETKTEAQMPAHETSADTDEPPPFYDDEEMVDEQDPNVLKNIMDNLAFLDYQPEEGEVMAEEDVSMSVEDSIEMVNWLVAEKAALTEREAALAARERDLKLLDKTVSKKLLTLEQAESSRINSLAKLYDSMDPRSVAQLMANLDDKTVVSLIPRMKIKNASAVLALMPPKRAAKLSKQMITIAEK
ncbi:MAG: hypothetical protein KAW61_06020 [candidate division Zixibacteria bacterium]|nr:hypothetical protein [candidate division Zixibacteria bacterium]